MCFDLFRATPEPDLSSERISILEDSLGKLNVEVPSWQVAHYILSVSVQGVYRGPKWVHRTNELHLDCHKPPQTACIDGTSIRGEPLKLCAFRQVVESIDEAEFLLAHGTECLGSAGDAEPREASLDEIRAVLEQGAKRDLPLLIANPDIVTVSGSGLIVMPGTFGRWYKEMGGQVSSVFSYTS